ncbi:MAG: aminomethyl-transferring glycine dehydrogenase subunit GcvPB [Thermoguttaceae bacterium]
MLKLLFEQSIVGSNSFSLPPTGLEITAENVSVNVSEQASADKNVQNDTVLADVPEKFLRCRKPELPELSEVEAVRHFTALSHRAFGVDDGMYPLGSCTMKYNPKINEWAARLPGFAMIHPYQDVSTVQGALAVMSELEEMLAEIGGMDRFSLQPAAGAQGELAGIMIIRAYHNNRGDKKRTVILVPDSAHGTNPATASVIGYKVREVKSNPQGLVDLEDLKSKLGDDVAGLMLTNPNTLGLFETEIVEMAKLVHEAGGLLYYDGANLNAIMGVTRPGDMGFDVVHYNLHKTFSTPHGGGGPDAGPVGVKSFLADFLPRPTVEKKEDGTFFLDWNRPLSIGKVKTFYGNFGVCLRAYVYIKSLGAVGIRAACQNAVLNANYLRHCLSDIFEIPFNTLCKHEFVASAERQLKENGVRTLDIAKRLIDFGYHPPTIYFPLIVHEAMMFEPTETESKERLDALIATMRQIAEECQTNPDLVRSAPTTIVISRVDETTAARNPILSFPETDK